MDIVDKYLKELERKLKTDKNIKIKIVEDIRGDIERYIADGKTAAEALERMGSPSEVAEEFNGSYPDHSLKCRRQRIRGLAIVSSVAATVCLLCGVIGREIYLRSDLVANVGGADRPISVGIIENPRSILSLTDFLIKISLVMLGVVILCAGYLIAKKKRDQ